MGASLRDVASLAGVSLATASLALNNKPVNADTRDKVLKAARKLNYQPNYAGRILKTGQSHVIGLFIVNQLENSLITEGVAFFYSLLRGAMEAVRRSGYAFQFGVEWVGPQFLDAVFRQVQTNSIDGLIMLPQWQSVQAHMSKFLQIDAPYVVINPIIPSEESLQVMMDNRKGAEIAIRYLASKGYREIGLLTGPEEHIDSIHRTHSYYETMALLGLEVHMDWVRQGDFSCEGGYRAMQQILTGSRHPRAMFCCDDYLAAGAMRAVFEKGLRVPEDIAFVGFDDTDVAVAVSPQLTTVKQACYELGSTAVELLLNRLAGREIPQTTITLQPTLIVRGSSG